MVWSIRYQLHVLRAYVVTTLCIAVALSVSAFRQPATQQNLGEITAERINIVDVNGTLRLVISNKDRMHPGVIGGKVLQRPRPYAGILFFNDHGDEAGGLVLTGREQNGNRAADAGLMFDQGTGPDDWIRLHGRKRQANRRLQSVSDGAHREA